MAAPKTKRRRAAPEAGDCAKLVYGVIQTEEELRFGRIGVGADPGDVYTIGYQDLAAVVSDVPSAVPELSRADAVVHQQVNERVMRDHTVLPMTFGTVFKSRDDVCELLRSTYRAFKDVLVKMDDKLEFGVKVLWDRERIVKELETEDEDIQRLKDEITTRKGSTYLARMKYGRLVDAAVHARSERYAHEIHESLRRIAVASRADRPTSDGTIMSAAFLVERRQQPDFDGMVRQLGARLDELTIAYTGPWPPYSFVNLRVKPPRV